MLNFKIIAVDFDGTLCENKWPGIGEPNLELIKQLKRERAAGAKLILWSCRVDDKLLAAVNWCGKQGLWFDAINENLPEVIEEFGSDTRKIFAHEYIDDKMCVRGNGKTFAHCVRLLLEDLTKFLEPQVRSLDTALLNPKEEENSNENS